MATPAYRAPAGLRRLRGGPLLRLRSDDQLLALFRAGSDEAFGVIHDRYRQRLLMYSRQMLGGSPSDAEDAMQDVFLRAYGALRADERPVSVRAWLYRVAHNRCIDQLRRPRPATIELLEDTAMSPRHDPVAVSQQREDLRRLVTDVGRLPEQQRSALLLRELEGLSYTEIAAALDCSVPAIKSLLVRARMGLAEQAEARALSCADIRDDLDQAHDRGVRMSGRARRHLRDCAACRSYRDTVKGVSGHLHALAPAAGPWALLAKILGLGSAGSGAAAGGAATVGGASGSVALIGGGAAATVGKVAAMVCCAAVVGGGAAEVQQRIAPATRSAPPAERSRPAAITAVGATPAIIHALDKTGPRPELARSTSPATDRIDETRARVDDAGAVIDPPLPGNPVVHGLLAPGVEPADGERAGGVMAPDEPVAPDETPAPSTAEQETPAPTDAGAPATQAPADPGPAEESRDHDGTAPAPAPESSASGAQASSPSDGSATPAAPAPQPAA